MVRCCAGLVRSRIVGGCDGGLLSGIGDGVGDVHGLAAANAAKDNPNDDYHGYDATDATANAGEVAFGVAMG